MVILLFKADQKKQSSMKLRIAKKREGSNHIIGSCLKQNSTPKIGERKTSKA